MTNRRLRLLYLNSAFPPGVSGRFPGLNPAGHAAETRTTLALSRFADVATVGLLPCEFYGQLDPRDGSIGVEHELLLWDKEPALWHRWRAWHRLREYYQSKVARDGMPDAVLVRNLTPVFNQFVRWLRRRHSRPVIVLELADSSTLGRPVSFSRRLRYAFKPMQTLDDQAIRRYEACISYGIGTRKYFEPRGMPWLWMPGASSFHYDPPPADPAQTGPIRFGYFGALAEHAAVIPLVRGFLDAGVPGSLHICGFGKHAKELKELAARHPNFRFDGLLQNQADCLAWAQQVDVLINPRLPIWGLENSFPSKIFEFGTTGKAILTTRTGGVDEVLGQEGLYLETENFEDSLPRQLREVAAMDRRELQRRGAAIRHRILTHFNWDEQARRMIEFIATVVKGARASKSAKCGLAAVA